MTTPAGAVFAPGFFASAPVHIALEVGALAAVVGAVVGIFTVLRGQSFAGEAYSDIGTTGGSGAFLVGIGPVWGFLIAGVTAAAAMEVVGVERARGRDLATGVVLGAALGLAALFLYLGTTGSSTSGATVTILFGSAFSTPTSTLPLAIALAVVAVATVAVCFRPLLLSSVSAELAAARGIPVRLLGVVYMLAVAVAMTLSAITIGTILSTALLVGPAATALRLTRSPARALLAAIGLSLAAMWIGIVLAYDSYDWPPLDHGWPVSFFVVTLVLAMYVLSGLPDALRRLGHRSGGRRRGPAGPRTGLSDV